MRLGPSIAACGATLLLLATPGVGFGQELWKGLRTGITVAQAQKALPEAKAYSPRAGETLASGDAPLLRVEDVTVGDTKGDASLFFADGKLSAVHLDLEYAEGLHRLNLSDAAEIAGLLRQKYGDPVSCGDRTVGSMINYRCEWSKGKTRISVFYLSIGSATTFKIAYVALDESPTDNL